MASNAMQDVMQNAMRREWGCPVHAYIPFLQASILGGIACSATKLYPGFISVALTDILVRLP